MAVFPEKCNSALFFQFLPVCMMRSFLGWAVAIISILFDTIQYLSLRMWYLFVTVFLADKTEVIIK